ncbi:hypothetical protein Tco_0291320 [Tanacetum coccineum]
MVKESFKGHHFQPNDLKLGKWEEKCKGCSRCTSGVTPPVCGSGNLDSGKSKFNRLPDVQGKGRSSAPTEPSGHDESLSLYAELGLTDSETESDEEVPGIDAGDQDEGQARPNPGIDDEG